MERIGGRIPQHIQMCWYLCSKALGVHIHGLGHGGGGQQKPPRARGTRGSKMIEDMNHFVCKFLCVILKIEINLKISFKTYLHIVFLLLSDSADLMLIFR